MPSLTLSSLALTVGLCTPAEPPQQAGPDPAALYAEGADYATFLAGTKRRVALLRASDARAAVPDAVLTRVTTAGGAWRLLVITQDGCSDTVNSLPYLARLADAAANIELRIVDERRGRPFMEAHRTPDGRPATPTVLLLADDDTLAGCWIERPAALQAWYVAHRPELDDAEYLRQKLAWYEADAGRSTLDEVVRMIEAAARGDVICGEPLPSQ